jgi:release factor glutamine methyltransferase
VRTAIQRRLWRVVVSERYRVERRRYRKLCLEEVDGIPLVVLPEVFNPKLLRSGEFLVQQVRRHDLVLPPSRVLDLGCGSGVCGLAAALAGCEVVASDINPAAVRCTQINALLNQVEARIQVRQGDLFDPVVGERFDVVLFNPPYHRGKPRDQLDYAWRSPDISERFAPQLAPHLSPTGRAVLVLSSDGERDAFLAALQRANFAINRVAERDLLNEIMTVYEVVRAC